MTLRFPKPPRRGRKPRKPIARGKRPAALSVYGVERELADDLSKIIVRAEHALGIAQRRAGVAKAPGCELCGAFAGEPKCLQWAHGITRGRIAIRYHPDNTFALCAACHMRYTYALRHEWDSVHRAMIGGVVYARLLAANRGGRRSVDLALVILDAEARISALPDGSVRDWALERRDAARAVYARRQ